MHGQADFNAADPPVCVRLGQVSCQHAIDVHLFHKHLLDTLNQPHFMGVGADLNNLTSSIKLVTCNRNSRCMQNVS